jgi:hypothetical protein
MCDHSWHEDATKTVRILQFIVSAMCAGVLFFLVIVLSIAPQFKLPAPLQPISLALIAAIFAGIGLIARAVVVWKLTVKARREIVNGTYAPLGPRLPSGSLPSDDGECHDAGYLLSVFQTKTIISGALFEGVSFFATIAYLIEGDPVSLGLAVVLILGLAAHFPTRSRVIGWVERQLEVVGQEKMLR